MSLFEQLSLRFPKSHREVHPRVNWLFIDPVLRLIKNRGSLSWLAAETGVSRTALAARRKELGLPALPRGAPRSTKLTEKEERALEAKRRGLGPKQLGDELGISRQAAFNLIKRAGAKPVTCSTCDGVGVEPCSGSCFGDVAAQTPAMRHFHVCASCGGAGSQCEAPHG